MRRWWAKALTLWRGSIHTRVVVSIVVLSGLVVSTVGWLVFRQIAEGLVDSRVADATAEATNEAASAQEKLGSAGGSDYDPSAQLRQLLESMVARADLRGYSVAVVGPTNVLATSESPSRIDTAGLRSSPGLDPASIPDRLRKSTEHSQTVTWTFTRIRYQSDRDLPSVPGVAAGARVLLPADGGTYELYFLFPMDKEEQTLGLLRQALLTAAGLLLLLIAGVTWLVTKQVITPIRLARRVAERIASGRLEERMQVSGEDDIARLAKSFNKMTDELQRQIRQLVELSTVQRRFVSDVSHELRTPLTTVRMASDVLHDARADFDPMTSRAAELLQTELDRFEILLADLLEISRFDAGAAVLELEETNLVDLAHRVVDSTAQLAQARDVRMEIHADKAVVVEVDPRRIERVVRNLVANAIDHAGDPGSRVVVRVAGAYDTAALTVRDFGIGLQPGQGAMVFNRFWRADPARARTSGGTGLGLAIAREDAHLHGGQLGVWGAPGEGCLFRLTLPLRAGDPMGHSPLPLVPQDLIAGNPLSRSEQA